MTYVFRPAQRSEAKPLIGFYSESGCGKTKSALLLARGFVGSQGRIGMIETESGRGEAYADPGEYPELAGPDPKANYEVLPLRADFSPAAYGEAITAAEQANLGALIIDSASHEWEGAGGVLGMAAKNQAEGKRGPLVWQMPKTEHQRHFMLRFMQTPIPLVILCMRAKYPMREIAKPGGGKEWVRSETLEPKQADDILFEMFVHGWIDQQHNFHLTKTTAKALEPVFANGRPISLETGRALAAWTLGGSTVAPSNLLPKMSTPPADLTDKEIAELLLRAEVRAKGGMNDLREFWEGLASIAQRAIKPEMERLKGLAKESDAAVMA